MATKTFTLEDFEFPKLLQDKENEIDGLDAKNKAMVVLALNTLAVLNALDNSNTSKEEVKLLFLMSTTTMNIVSNALGADKNVWGSLVGDVMDILDHTGAIKEVSKNAH